MKECDVESQWNHVRHIPKCESLCWLKPHKDKLEGKEEYGDQKDKKKPFSIKFETKDDTQYRLVIGDKEHVGKTSDKEFEQRWQENKDAGNIDLYINQNLVANLKENQIDDYTFWHLNEGEFENIVGIKSFGKRKRLLRRIEDIKEEHEKAMEEKHKE